MHFIEHWGGGGLGLLNHILVSLFKFLFFGEMSWFGETKRFSPMTRFAAKAIIYTQLA